MDIQKEWTDLTIAIDKASTQADMKKTVSVRLDYQDLAAIDVLAQELGQSRQWVISLMIDQVLPQAIRGCADAYEAPERSAGFLKEMNEKVQEKAIAMAADDGHKLELIGWILKTTLNPEEVQYLKKRDGKGRAKA